MSDDIVQLEWEFFQHVQHIDGRASCQDDFETFYLQRKSQFDAFDQDVQQACLQDLKVAKQMGRNPVMEKYAYMMESTDKDYYDTIKDQLPERSEEQMDIINTICRIEVAMREVFDQQYPRLSSLARDTHTGDDQQENTSFETYLRGELSTYSPETLYLYGRMIANMYQNGQNMILMIQEKTVQAYGYRSLDDAEAKM